MRNLLIALLLIVAIACETGTKKVYFDWQGHRGARGEAPENTIPAMLKALQEGVHTLEMDVVISADSQVVVSHEPFLNPEICLDTNGADLTDSVLLNIYQLDYKEIAKYDCGSKPYPSFPGQEKYVANKPRLLDLIVEVEEAILMSGLKEPNYNIEIKSRPEWEGVFHPDYETYTNLVLEDLDKASLAERLVIQSFDPRVLQYLNENRPDIRLAYLVESKEVSVKEQIEALGFIPNIYSPHYSLLDQRTIQELHALGVKVIPWTVNEIEQAQELQGWGVDGIITDYPARMIGTLGL